MGEQADLILNGDVCEWCGCFFEDSGDGYPRHCEGCEIENNQSQALKGKKLDGKRTSTRSKLIP